MLRIVESSGGAGAAARYFESSLTTGDYYSKEAERPGLWGGKGAEQLGLSGTVEKAAFQRLSENLHPATGEQLTPRMKANRRAGYDLNFHCPKSVSIAHALVPDSGIEARFVQAVQETMGLIEAEMRTRVRTGGADEDRPTKNLTYGLFVHDTSRPVDGIPDPHLHAHCFTFNATFDGAEGRWKAGQFGQIKSAAGYFEASFQSRLAELLRADGWATDKRGRYFELGCVTDDAIKRFSRRTALIEEHAERKGITDPVKKAALGAKTRKRKDQALPMQDVRADWERRLSQTEWAQLLRTRPTHKEEAKETPPPLLNRNNEEFAPSEPALHGKREVQRTTTAHPQPIFAGPPAAAPVLQRDIARAVDLALLHSFERSSVVPEHKVLEEALRFGSANLSPAAIRDELISRDLIRTTEHHIRYVTTKEVLQEEQRVLAFARDGRGTQLPFKKATLTELEGLSPSQISVLERTLASRDKVTLIRGVAGAGKSRLMEPTVAAMERQGATVTVLAPTARASKGALREAGFDKATTVAHFLASQKAKNNATRSVLDKVQRHQSVIWVDEAGLMGVKDMNQLFAAAARCGARVVLSGDTKQHHSVSRGDALRLLETKAGLRSFELAEIKRQTGAYKEAITALSEGRVAEGFLRLDDMRAIHENEDPTRRFRDIARSWMSANQRGHSTVVVAPTHKECDAATASIREARKERGELKKDRPRDCLKRSSLTEAERMDPKSYVEGMVIEFHRSPKTWLGNLVRPIRAGDRAEIVGVDQESGTVRARVATDMKRGLARSGFTFDVPLHKVDKFTVYEKEKLPIAKGDTILITKSGYSMMRKGLTHVPFDPETAAKGCGSKKEARRIFDNHTLLNGTLATVKRITPMGHLVLDNGKVVSRNYGHIAYGYCVTSHVAQGLTANNVIVVHSANSMKGSRQAAFYVEASRGRREINVFTDNKHELLESLKEHKQRDTATEQAERSERLRHQAHMHSRDTRQRQASVEPPRQQHKMERDR